MDELNILKRLNRVKAPENFERSVLENLARGKNVRAKRLIMRRLVFACSAALVVIGVIVFGLIPSRNKTNAILSEKGKIGIESVEPLSEQDRKIGRQVMPLLETVDYSDEIRSVNFEPRMVYILEHVSEERYSGIKY